MYKRKPFVVFLFSNFIALSLITSHSIAKDKTTMRPSPNNLPRLTFSVISDINLRSGKDYRGYPYHDKEADRKFASALKDISYINRTQNALIINGHQPILHADVGNSNYIINAAMLHRIVKQYPVIFFSGHSHETLREQSKITYNDGLIAFNDSSVRNPVRAYHTPVDDSEGLYVQVYEGKVVIKGRDFTHKSWLNQYSVSIPQSVTDF